MCLKQKLKKLEDLYEEYFEWIMARGSTTGHLLRHSGSAGLEFDPTDSSSDSQSGVRPPNIKLKIGLDLDFIGRI